MTKIAKLRAFSASFSLRGPVAWAILMGAVPPASRSPVPPTRRGKRDIPGWRQGHLPESWARHRRTHRRENHSRHHLRILSSAHRLERHDGARARRQRRQRRPAQGHHRRGGRAAVRAARRRQDRQPSELERTLQGQLRQDADRLDLRHGRRAQEPDVPEQVEEPVVPREADARSRQGADHLRGVRGDAREGARRSSSGSIEALEKCFIGQGAQRWRAPRRAGQGRQAGEGCARRRWRSRRGAPRRARRKHRAFALSAASPGPDAPRPGVFHVRDETSCVLRTAVAAVRSVVTYLAILAYIAVAAPLALLLGGVFRSKRRMYALGHGGVGLALALAGIRYRVAGPRARPGDAPSSSARTTRATSTRRCCSRRCTRGCTSSTRPSCTSFRSWARCSTSAGSCRRSRRPRQGVRRRSASRARRRCAPATRS